MCNGHTAVKNLSEAQIKLVIFFIFLIYKPSYLTGHFMTHRFFMVIYCFLFLTFFSALIFFSSRLILSCFSSVHVILLPSVLSLLISFSLFSSQSLTCDGLVAGLVSLWLVSCSWCRLWPLILGSQLGPAIRAGLSGDVPPPGRIETQLAVSDADEGEQ